MFRIAPRAAAVVLCSLLAMAGASGSAAAPAGNAVTLNATGSTLLYPLFQRWADVYPKSNPGVRVVVSATNSETGIAQAIAGTVQIGTTDAFMSDEAMNAAPGIINVPLAIAAQLVVYNIPSMPRAAHLKLDGPALAAIYSGAARTWDAPAIAALNPGITLPHQSIVPVRRDPGSGDTFIFSQYLAFSTRSWERLVGYRTTIPWPRVEGAVDTSTNEAMLQALKAHPYAIGYVGSSYAAGIAAAGLGTALLKNAAGNFTLPTPRAVLSAAATLGPRTPPDERLTLVFAPGSDSYPLISYEYAVVSTKQPSPALAEAVRNFLFWAIAPCNGNAKPYLDAVNFIPLPEYVRALSYVQIESIK